MDGREKIRMGLTRDVLRLLRIRDFRAALPPLRDGEKEAAILVAFRDEALKSVLGQVALLGGHVNVVIPPQDLKGWPSGLAILQVTTGERASEPRPMDEDDCLVNEQSELGMLLELLHMRKRTMTLHLCRQETTVELVDDGKDLARA